MKKYAIAGAVAVSAFAFSAFAASLDVNAGTLQAGEDRDLECADAANVAAWGYDDTNGTNLLSVKIDLVGNECSGGEHLHALLLDADGSQLARGMDENGANPPRAIDEGVDEYTFYFPGGVDVQLVEGIRIGIDQGNSDYSY